MAVKEEIKEDKKGLLGKLKEAADDKEEQLAILSTFVRLSVLVWSAGILTLAYVKLPAAFKIPEFQFREWVSTELRLTQAHTESHNTNHVQKLTTHIVLITAGVD